MHQRFRRLLPLLALAGICPSGCQNVRPSPPPQMQFGWDYGLSHRCIHGPHPQAANYYDDALDCPTPGKAWTIAVQSETVRAGYGPTDQSFPINQPGSPAHLDWTTDSGKGRNARQTVRLTTDFESTTHPGGEGYFTWFVLMDHIAYGGGPFPRPDETVSTVRVVFDDSTPHGATRAFGGYTALWDGKMHGIEICFALANWGDADAAADIVSTINKDNLEFVLMDGRALGITAPRGRETFVEFPWHRIVQALCRRGYFTPPQQGWDHATTAAVYVGTEVNNFTASHAARASLSIADFRIERRSSQTSTRPSLTPGGSGL